MSKEEYIVGEIYEGLGKYLGTHKLYPWGVDYYIVQHRFSEKPPTDRRMASKINTIDIERIKR